MMKLLPYRLLVTCMFLFPALIQCYCKKYEEQEVAVLNRVDSIELYGTLTVPLAEVKGSLVLATGSGVQNRDEEIFGHRPFKIIAEYLSENGYAVLRMDDRGFGRENSSVMNEVNDDFVSDILSGIKFLRSSVPNSAYGVLGHSEGGSTAVKIASRFPDECDFIITLAAPAWAGDSVVMSQSRAIATALTGSWEGEKTERQILDIVKSSLPDYRKKVFITGILSEQLGAVAQLPQVQSSLSQQIETMLSPWYKDMLLYDPSTDIRQVNISWLALNGDKDVQVLPENLKTIEDYNNKVSTRKIEGHNHLFQRCSTGLPQEYPLLSEDISHETLEIILSWLDNLCLVPK